MVDLYNKKCPEKSGSGLDPNNTLCVRCVFWEGSFELRTGLGKHQFHSQLTVGCGGERVPVRLISGGVCTRYNKMITK